MATGTLSIPVFFFCALRPATNAWRSSLISQGLLRVCVRRILAVVGALDRLQDGLHLLGLSLPLLLGHLGLPTEELFIGLAVAASQAVPQRGELSVIVVEVQVVHGVARSTVDDRAVGDILAIMDHDSPEVDEAEENDIGDLLKREDEGEDVVRDTLGPAIQRVECVGGEWTGHDPLVMRLVESLVDERVVQASVDPVDEEVGESDEERELQDAVEWEGFLGDAVVEFGVAPDFRDKERDGQEGHEGHGLHGLSDLLANLVLEVLGVLDSCFIPDKHVR